jgi:hypothetical protein
VGQGAGLDDFGYKNLLLPTRVEPQDLGFQSISLDYIRRPYTLGLIE